MNDLLKGNIQITPLKVEDLNSICTSYREAPDGYNRYFTPFEITSQVLEEILQTATRDRYYGIHVDGVLAGFYMLRGFDHGFKIPTYGVWIAPKFSGNGIGRLTLDHAMATCRLIGVKELMLKAHPENTSARKLYEKCGFKKAGFDDKNGNYVYTKKL